MSHRRPASATTTRRRRATTCWPGVAARRRRRPFSAAGFAERSAPLDGRGRADAPPLTSRWPFRADRRADSDGASTGLPLAGATVTYPGGVTTTDAGGAYRVDGIASGAQVHRPIVATASSARTSTVRRAAGRRRDAQTSRSSPNQTYVVGEVRDIGHQPPRWSAPASSVSSGQTTTTDALGPLSGRPAARLVHASPRRRRDYQADCGPIVINGGSYATLDFLLAPDTVSPSTDRPRADGRREHQVQQRDQELRARHRDPAACRRRVGATPRTRRTSGSPSAAWPAVTVTAASLRLFVTDAGPDGGAVYPDRRRTWARDRRSPSRTRHRPAHSGSGPRSSVNAPRRWIDVPLAAGRHGDRRRRRRVPARRRAARTASTTRVATARIRPSCIMSIPGGPGPTPTPTADTDADPDPDPRADADADPGTDADAHRRPDPDPRADADADRAPTPTPPPPRRRPRHRHRRPPRPDPDPDPAGRRRIDDQGDHVRGRTARTRRRASTASRARSQLDTAPADRRDRVRRIAGTSGYLQEALPATGDPVSAAAAATDRSEPGSRPRILMLSSGGTTTANLVLEPTGRLRLRDGSTTIGADSPPLAVGTDLCRRRCTSAVGRVPTGWSRRFLAVDGGTARDPIREQGQRLVDHRHRSDPVRRDDRPPHTCASTTSPSQRAPCPPPGIAVEAVLVGRRARCGGPRHRRATRSLTPRAGAATAVRPLYCVI